MKTSKLLHDPVIDKHEPSSRARIFDWIPAGLLGAILICSSSASAQTLYSTGFENPPFTTGSIVGQDGWQVFGQSNAVAVENSFAKSGAQAVEVTPALDSSQTGPYHVDSTAAGMVDLSADIYIASSSNQSGWQFAGLNSTGAPFLGGIDIFSDGSIHTITAGFPTVGTWAYNAWNHVDLLFNVSAQTYTLTINGVQLASGVANCGDNGPCTGGTASNYGRGFFDTFGTASNNDIGYIDNYSVTVVHGSAMAPYLVASVNHPNPTGPGAIDQYTPTGVQSTLRANVVQPRGLAFDCDGNLFAASTGSDDNGNSVGTILKVTPGGVVSTFTTGFPNNYFLQGIAVDSMGNLFVFAQNDSDPHFASTIFKVSPGGGVSIFGTVPGQGFGLAFDSMGNLFAADSLDETIFKFTPAGMRSVFAGPSAFLPNIQGPTGLAFDSAGNLFVSTEGNSPNDAILKFTASGMETTFATGLTNNPRGLAFDSAGNLFVAETGVGRSGDILKFTPGGVETTFAAPVGRPQGNGGPEFLAFPPPPCQFTSSIASNFNGTAIRSGSTIWFNSVLSPSGVGAAPVTFSFTNQTISSSSFTVAVPDAQVTFDPAATSATTTFTGGMWVTRVPSKGLAGNTFFSGVSYQVPANIPGGVKNVTWSGTITSDTPTASLQWQWGAAVYTSFGPDYNSDGVKPVDDNKASTYKNSDHAGTPENFKASVTGGATGGGGSNYTGSASGTVKIGPCCSR
jgi:hypothetical protein